MAERKGNKVLSVQDIISLRDARLMSREEARRELGFIDEETTKAEPLVNGVRKFQVGDKISRRDARNLPDGSVITYAPGSPQIVQNGRIWERDSEQMMKWDTNHPSHTIVYLP